MGLFDSQEKAVPGKLKLRSGDHHNPYSSPNVTLVFSTGVRDFYVLHSILSQPPI
jgi:hypothetical protein